MALPKNFIESLVVVDTRELFKMMTDKTWPKGGVHIELVNEVRPVDLFCYLGGRFGAPNGIQSFLRKDDSDNLIHWQWTLRNHCGLVSFSGMNFRSEVHFCGNGDWVADDKDELIRQLQSDFAPRGSEMGKVRGALENWVEFVNPYQRIRRAIDRLLEELDALDLQPDNDKPDIAWDAEEPEAAKKLWEETTARYSKGFGLCFGIRSMLPVLAEAYVNLLLFILLRPEIKGDERLRDNVFRQPIDVRIKSLSINCIGFERMPDYSSEECRRYHTLANERNDLLHGNVTVDKLKFNDVHFLGKIPVFKEYRSMWQRSQGIEVNAVGLRGLRDEIVVVDNLIGYLNSCLHEGVRPEIERMTSCHELGLNRATQRLGILFPPWLVDMRMRLPNAADQVAKASKREGSPDQ